MSGTALLYSVLLKLCELNSNLADENSEFKFYFNSMKDFSEQELREILKKLKMGGFIEYSEKTWHFSNFIENVETLKQEFPPHFKVQLLAPFTEYYLKVKSEYLGYPKKSELNNNINLNKKNKYKLSTRQREVLQIRSEGYNQIETADKMGIKPTTIRKHEEGIFRNLGTNSIEESIKVAVKNKVF